MPFYRNNLPQIGAKHFLNTGGLETTLIFLERIDLPYFAAFDLLKDQTGREVLRRIYATYAAIAQKQKIGIILESGTWRASRDWGEKLGYSRDALMEANQASVALMEEVRKEFQTADAPMVLESVIGPRGDGYSPKELMGVDEAEHYHAEQVEWFQGTEADFIAAITMTYPEEAIGLCKAAQAQQMPVVISFTVETDGMLPSGHSLKEAVEAVEEATQGGPAYYMINCAHPTHFEAVLSTGESWTNRLRGILANASSKSHAELDEAVELDEGNPVELAEQMKGLSARLGNLNILGGCCGTDHRHIEEIGKVWAT
ncbi:MAG: homocysteine S-methyltransferase family protein [SAR324 cluster bacterium]|nr:homocysteine S-methyltransferase family protein [SAR324 cluster bacterium]